MWRAVLAAIRKKTPYWRLFLYPDVFKINKKEGMTMKRTNKFETDEVVILISTGEKVTINKSSYIPNMKRYSYTIKENPSMFYFEDELATID